ncbi:MAG: glycosyltransferase family 4 protein [Polyangiaceae bacterium]|jgi:PEP-CTERM/exosortase A-associated glycosyltransferase|nr:glycosyltransferase family 4 protein [Polyangiaceae bacterium]
MRVLHVLHTSLPFICGYSIRSDYILRYQREQGFEPAAVVTSGQQPPSAAEREEIDGVSYFRTPPAPEGGLKVPFGREAALMRMLAGRVADAIRETRPHLVHAHSPMLVGLPALWAARRAGLPLVYEIRDLWENASVDRGKFSPSSPLYKAARGAEGVVLRNANAVVTICESLRAELAPRVAQSGALSVVANGVDTERFVPRPKNPEFARKYGLEGKRVVGYVGTFQPYEGLEVLVRAMTEITRALPDARLVITGAGGEEPRLRQVAAEQKLGEHVVFTGRLPHDQVFDVYALADLLVYPRLLTRTTALTTPLKPLEAMAMARAVMVSDVPAMRELVKEGHTGMVFRAGDQAHLAARCVELLSDEARRRSLGAAAREFVVAERRWPVLVERYQRIYESALGAPLDLKPPRPADGAARPAAQAQASGGAS